jgi:hypothetical protein
LKIDASSVPYHAVQINSGAGGYIRIRNNEIIAPNQGCVMVAAGADYNWLIGNDIHHCGVNNPAYPPGYNSVYISSNNNLIETNTVHDGHNGIALWSQTALPSNNVVRRNLVYNMGLQIRDDSQCYFARAINNQIYNNICYRSPIGVRLYGDAFNTLVYNNTLYAGANSSGTTRGVYIQSGSNNFVKNNIIYNFSIPIDDFGSGTAKNNNLTPNPRLVDPANGNFRLQPDSAAIEAGVNLSPIVVDDFDGLSRTQDCCYDIGAYEYR